MYQKYKKKKIKENSNEIYTHEADKATISDEI